MKPLVNPVSADTDSPNVRASYPQPLPCATLPDHGSGGHTTLSKLSGYPPHKSQSPAMGTARAPSVVAASVGSTHGRGAPQGAKPLPCLYSNNDILKKVPVSIDAAQSPLERRHVEKRITIQRRNDERLTTREENKPKITHDLNRLSPYHKRQAETLFQNTSSFVHQHGINNVGFLTLTFADNVTDHKEAYRRFKSLNANFLSNHFGAWILVKERQCRGAWHYHLLIDCMTDIRTGVNMKQLSKGNYSSCGDSLRGLWKTLRQSMPKYGFGRSELLPIKSTVEGVARYVGKYISKHVGVRETRDKGVRLFSASRNFRASTTNFAWSTPNAWVWRMKVKEFARFNGIATYGGLQMHLGKNWAFKYLEIIYQTSLPSDIVYPTVEHWQAHRELPEVAWPFEYKVGMTNFQVIDGSAKQALYDREASGYSSPKLMPKHVLSLPMKSSKHYCKEHGAYLVEPI